MKKLLSILLAVLMVVSVVPMSASAEENITYEVGDIIEFGSYPQSKVTDETLIAELNALDLEWTYYDYYSSGSQSNYAKYSDVEYNGEKYRAVTFSHFRPVLNTERAQDYYTIGGNSVTPRQYLAGYMYNEVYWFKYEPINWVVVNSETGLLLSEELIDAQSYCNKYYAASGSSYVTYYNSSAKTHFANDYYTSTIRNWLINDFYTHSFNEKEALLVVPTDIGAGSSSTTDSVFFVSSEEFANVDKALFSAEGTDYSICQGLYSASWWLRRNETTKASDSGYAELSEKGTLHGAQGNVNCAAYGVRPAITFDLVKYTCTHEWESTTTATCTQPGESTYTCNLCGSSYTEEVPATGHTYTSEITTPATHLTEGVKTFTCACGDTYTEPVAKLEGHTYTSEVTKEATHLEEGETTYICACGDSYTEAISKLTGHTYKEVVTEPTCTAKGYTTYTCECGDTYVDDYTDELDHEYTSEITTPATHLTEGVKTFTCACGDTYTEPVAKLKDHTYTSEVTTEPTHLTEGVKTFTCACGDTYTESVAKLEEHTYKEVVTEPTCTTKGYTTYTCECGDNYVDNYVGIKEHSYSASVTTPATHTKEGVMTYTCSSCGDTYTATISKTPEHAYTNSYVVEPTCEKEGYTAHVCDCGDIIKDNYTEKTGHSYNGRVCEDCGKNCSCMCHYSGFMSFIWKIINFFYKLFRVNKVCACGIAHY